MRDASGMNITNGDASKEIHASGGGWKSGREYLSTCLAPLRAEPLELAVIAFLALPFQLGLLVLVAHVVRINCAVLSGALRGSRLFGEIALLLALSG